MGCSQSSAAHDMYSASSPGIPPAEELQDTRISRWKSGRPAAAPLRIRCVLPTRSLDRTYSRYMQQHRALIEATLSVAVNTAIKRGYPWSLPALNGARDPDFDNEANKVSKPVFTLLKGLLEADPDKVS